MGLILVYTGDGKGKTSAGVGQVVRALGHGARVKVAQFIKDSASTAQAGEYRLLSSLGVEFKSFGAGFTWIASHREENCRLALAGWNQVISWIESKECDLILLDEFTYPLSLGYLEIKAVISYLTQAKTEKTFPHLVITGRSAPPELVALADMVSSIEEIKHHFHEKNRPAAPLIEF